VLRKEDIGQGKKEKISEGRPDANVSFYFGRDRGARSVDGHGFDPAIILASSIVGP
jgi:hypothetical protein